MVGVSKCASDAVNGRLGERPGIVGTIRLGVVAAGPMPREKPRGFMARCRQLVVLTESELRALFRKVELGCRYWSAYTLRVFGVLPLR